MTIVVNGPGGITIHFPDGTDANTINQAMTQASGGGGAKSDLPAAQDGSVSADNVVRSVARGVPVVGSFLDEANAATNATLAPLIDPLLPDSFQKLPGKTWQERYDQAVAIQRGKDQSYDAEHPVLSAGGQLTGAVGGTIAGLRAIPGAPAALGVTGGALPARIGAGLASGAGIGAVQGFGAGEGSPAERLPSAQYDAAITGAIGGTVPVVGSVIGASINAVRGWLPSELRSGASKVTQAMQRDAVTPDMLEAAPATTMLADLGPNLTRQAGALAATPGRGQEIVRDALGTRSAGANQRIISEVDDTLGRAPVPGAVIEGIEGGQRALGPEYGEVFRNARAVETRPIANFLDAEVVTLRGPAQTAMRRVREMLNVVGSDQLDRDPATLFQVRQAIDGLLEGETNSRVIRALTNVRRQADTLLAQSVPGLKNVDAKFAELARQRTALGRGQQVLDSGRTAPRPGELADEVVAGVQPEGTLVGPSAAAFRLSQGARAEIDRIVGTNQNDVVALQKLIKGEGSWNRDRLVSLFGQERADRIIRLVDRERNYANTANRVTQNSETAARSAAIADFEGSSSLAGILRTGSVKAVEGILKAVGSKALSGSGEEAARLLTATGLERAHAVRMLRLVAQRTSSPEIKERASRLSTLILAAGNVAVTPRLAGP